MRIVKAIVYDRKLARIHAPGIMFRAGKISAGEYKECSSLTDKEREARRESFVKKLVDDPDTFIDLVQKDPAEKNADWDVTIVSGFMIAKRDTITLHRFAKEPPPPDTGGMRGMPSEWEQLGKGIYTTIYDRYSAKFTRWYDQLEAYYDSCDEFMIDVRIDDLLFFDDLVSNPSIKKEIIDDMEMELLPTAPTVLQKEAVYCQSASRVARKMGKKGL